ncbi:MAG: N-acetylmuramoyl-L-alanine amidase, partial [Nitrospirota bacterium]
MIQKTILCLIIITILSPFIRDSQGTPVSKRSAQSRFNAAAACENSLRESKKKQKYRKNWEECIRKFISLKSSVVTNENGLKEKSLFRAAGLYLGLYRYSGKRSDLLNAKELFSNVTTDYPGSELYRLSRTEVNRIEEIIKKNGGEGKKDIDVKGRAEARDIRYWSHQKYTRIVLDLDTLVRFDQAASPPDDKVTLNLYNLYVGEDLKRKIEAINDSIIKEVQVSERGPDAIAISFGFDGLKKFKAFPLPSPPRIVIDIFGKDTNKNNTLPPSEEPPSKKDKMVSSQPAQKIDTIIIDPGHGGKDPGAIGKSGLTEKEVVLD